MGPSHNDIAESTSERKATPAVNPEAAPGVKIPAILLEGDQPAPLPESSSQEPKYALGAAAKPPVSEAQASDLPAAYGTGKLWLAARDPHALYAHWDLPLQQQHHFIELAHQHHLALRVHLESLTNSPLAEIQLPQESRHLFVPVVFAGKRYVAELGYYPVDHEWKSLAVSDVVATPPEGISPDKTVRFATLPPAVPVSGPPPESANLKPAKGTENIPAKTFPLAPISGSPAEPPAPGLMFGQENLLPDHSAETSVESEFIQAEDWTTQQEKILGELIDWGYPGSPSSAELTEGRVSELETIVPGIEVPFGNDVSSPSGGEVPAPKEFWLSVNAELVVYGATLPGAKITIGGRPVQLRPDGTFSFRFALPDGRYELPIEAVATDGDLRRAILEFYRRTSCQGEVRAHPQSPELKDPEAGTR